MSSLQAGKPSSSRLVRFMAIMAWLLLVVGSWPAMASAPMAGPAHAQGMHAAMKGDCCAAAAHDAHGAHASCHCDALCGAMLLPVTLSMALSPLPQMSVPRRPDSPAPRLPLQSPLRPPSV